MKVNNLIMLMMLAIIMVSSFTVVLGAALPDSSLAIASDNTSSISARLANLNETSLNDDKPTVQLHKRAKYLHGPPFCTPTGPGVCNLAWHKPDSSWDGGLWDAPKWNIFLYDRFCREIGMGKEVRGNFHVYSELPFVIIGNTVDEQFKYADDGYINKCIRYSGDMQEKSTVRQCAFECWQGCWYGGEGATKGPCK